MSASLLALNLGILVLVLASGLGTHQLTSRRVVMPLAVTAVFAYAFLRDMPTTGHDVAFEVLGGLAGVALGVAAAALVRVRAVDGRVITTAGAGFAALWIAVVGGRIAFAYGATSVFPTAIARFSRDHEITSAAAWTAMFVLMGLAMIASRTLVTVARAAYVSRHQRATAPSVA